MAYFFYRLAAPRPTFPQDMTADEAAIMHRHVEYWQELSNRGTAVVFGPVADPGGGWGLAIVEAATEEEADAIRHGDPAVTSGLTDAAILSMPRAILRRAVMGGDTAVTSAQA